MKKNYVKPSVRMIDFTYDMQVVAQSQTYIKTEETPHEWFDKCQVDYGTCQLLYYSDMTCALNKGEHFSLRD